MIAPHIVGADEGIGPYKPYFKFAKAYKIPPGLDWPGGVLLF